MVLGIDIGTTSVAGVAVASGGRVVASVTVAHQADLPSNGNGVDEQDPAKILSAVEMVKMDLLARLPDGDRPQSGDCPPIGWTGQMHGVVAVDDRLHPISPFVTWRDARRYGGPVMAQWGQSLKRGQSPFKGGLSPFKCLPVCGLPQFGNSQKCKIDPSFLESWHLEMGTVPTEWLPEVVEGSMLGDNQAGVYAAQHLVPGCAVVNLGTSGQLSLVVDGDSPRTAGDSPLVHGDSPSDGDRPRIERRWFPGGRTLLCRASLVGGQAWAALQRESGASWEDLNEAALSQGDSPLARRARSCIRGIVDDLVAGFDLSGVKGIVGVGNALVRNPALRQAVEDRFGLPCIVPQVDEMAAYGAALYRMSQKT